MEIFTANELLTVAKRLNNSKRSYLLVNPLQGKHLPTNPTLALEMMSFLGKKVVQSFNSARLVIGFAETATAIGAVVAKNISNDCFYLQTTRENISGNFIEFLEEHSHAPQQKLFAENLFELINATNEVIFVDDELSTGKTLLNIVKRLKNEFPALKTKKICAASVINRLLDENLANLAAENIFCVYLVRLNQNFDADKFQVEESQSVTPAQINFPIIEVNFPLNTRYGVKIGDYFAQCHDLGDFIRNELQISGKTLILGTEEFMLPAIIAAQNFSALTHSTTRSPIGICQNADYPINSGFKLRSFYDSMRTTFIYNLKHYDSAIIITDSENFSAGLQDLTAALKINGVKNIFCVRCRNV